MGRGLLFVAAARIVFAPAEFGAKKSIILKVGVATVSSDRETRAVIHGSMLGLNVTIGWLLTSTVPRRQTCWRLFKALQHKKTRRRLPWLIGGDGEREILKRRLNGRYVFTSSRSLIRSHRSR